MTGRPPVAPLCTTPGCTNDKWLTVHVNGRCDFASDQELSPGPSLASGAVVATLGREAATAPSSKVAG